MEIIPYTLIISLNGYVENKNFVDPVYLLINTQYMTNSTLVCPVKIEYVTKNNIFGLKMMVKRTPCHFYY